MPRNLLSSVVLFTTGSFYRMLGIFQTSGSASLVWCMSEQYHHIWFQVVEGCVWCGGRLWQRVAHQFVEWHLQSLRAKNDSKELKSYCGCVTSAMRQRRNKVRGKLSRLHYFGEMLRSYGAS